MDGTLLARLLLTQTGYGIKTEGSLPPLSDPKLYHLFIHCNHRTSKQRWANDELKYRDLWRVYELNGDKFLSDVISCLFIKYTLPHNWAVALLSLFMSKLYQTRIILAHGLHHQCLGSLSGKGLANALEVLPSHSLTIQVYCAALHHDPIYNFTLGSAADYLFNFFEVSWLPLLHHMQETYAPPIRLDNIPCPHYTAPDNLLNLPNFHYHEVTKYDIKASIEFQMLQAAAGAPMNLRPHPGWQSTLTVTIPASLSHPYWTTEHYSYDIEPDTLSFHVTRWGPSPDEANYYSSQRAQDIIQTIRLKTTIKSQIPAVPWNKATRLLSCPTYILAKSLHNLWKSNKHAFTTPSDPFWTSAISTIQNFASTHPTLILLLNYHEVFSPPPPALNRHFSISKQEI
jgi:hypothetical protein